MKQRPKNSRVTHGQPACADYGCKRDECLEARRRAMKQREYFAATGRPALPGTERTAAHIARLRAAGMLDAETCRAARVGRDAFYKAARFGGKITRVTEAKILAVPVPRVVQPETGNRARIDGRSTLLRLRALMALGWPQYVIAREMGIAKSFVSRLVCRLGCGDRYVTLATAQKTQRVYERLWNQDPLEHGVPASAVTRAKAIAAAGKWQLPMDLDDDVLDDPTHSRVIDVSPRKKSSPRTSPLPAAADAA
ncbi:hypothetical protein [Streptomyces sp. NBC_01353]|uniref:hypothetical protein n=1 Tax=Streptomyces sp. NBC_01353 TaxID=2903835 RepID=UPI002E3807ED|nr:hypothetical protein [Streptomyces sp. NBC_01353]